MKARKFAFALFSLMALAGCSLDRDTEPPRTATEQLLISSAVDRAMQNFEVKMEPGTKVFMDNAYVEGIDTKYTMGAIRDRLLKAGARMVAKKDDADIVVEPRIGAQSIDQGGTLIGIPSFSIPVPLESTPVTTPEIALFKKQIDNGVSKFAMTGYDAKTGDYKFSVGPELGESHRTHWVVLLLISWTTEDYQ